MRTYVRYASKFIFFLIKRIFLLVKKDIPYINRYVDSSISRIKKMFIASNKIKIFVVISIVCFVLSRSIQTTSIIVGILAAIYNLMNTSKSIQNTEDAMLYNITTAELDKAIEILEKPETQNDNFSWHVAAEQLSPFHNLAIGLNNEYLRKCYCAKLHAYILRIRNILERIDDYRFFYGVEDYKDKDLEALLVDGKKHISPNALNCIAQFLLLFQGANADYLFREGRSDEILKPIVYGFWDENEHSREQIEKMPQPFKNIYQYIREASGGVTNLQKNRDSK